MFVKILTLILSIIASVAVFLQGLTFIGADNDVKMYVGFVCIMIAPIWLIFIISKIWKKDFFNKGK